MSHSAEATAKRTVNLDYDITTRRMVIVYDPENAGGSRTRLQVQPWRGAHEFLVNETQAAGCNKWIVRVRVEWDAQSALDGDPGTLLVSYRLEDYDVRDLMDCTAH